MDCICICDDLDGLFAGSAGIGVATAISLALTKQGLRSIPRCIVKTRDTWRSACANVRTHARVLGCDDSGTCTDMLTRDPCCGSMEEAHKRFLILDKDGALTMDRRAQLNKEQRAFMRDDVPSGWRMWLHTVGEN